VRLHSGLEKDHIAMKLVSSVSLALVLALGSTVMLAPQSAVAAKKEKAPKAAAPTLSKEFRAAIAPAQAAMQKKDVAAAEAALAVATPLAKLPDEIFFLGSIGYEVANAKNDKAGIRKGIDMMVDSGSKIPTNLDKLNMASGQMAYQAGEYQKAIDRLTAADQQGSKDINRLLLTAEAHFKLSQWAQGLGVLNKAAEEQKASGQAVPEDWYRRGVSVSLKSKNTALITDWSHKLVRNNPSATNWRDALIIFRDSAKLDAKSQLDIARLMYETKSLAGERDFNDYAALAIEGKLPWEAEKAIQAGLDSGAVVKTSKPIQERLAEVKTMSPVETSALMTDQKKALTTGTAVYALNVANALISHGDNDKALEMLGVAEKRAGADLSTVNMLRGIALARLGRKDEAKAAFSAVTASPKAEIGSFWKLYLDLGAATAG
jgi:hypothetical protein